MRCARRLRSRARASPSFPAGSSRRGRRPCRAARRARCRRGRCFEVERQALLVAVDAQEVRALAAEERRTPRARVVALARLLDLDDARAHVGEQHRAVRTGQHAREVEDGDAGEWRVMDGHIDASRVSQCVVRWSRGRSGAAYAVCTRPPLQAGRWRSRSRRSRLSARGRSRVAAADQAEEVVRPEAADRSRRTGDLADAWRVQRASTVCPARPGGESRARRSRRS